jgi:hypothetical protein
LAAIYNAPSATPLTFKGGTSLSKVYKVIDRFSEDIDLTYDIRELVPDLLRDGKPIPDSPSQEKKVTRAVRERLPDWIAQTIKPRIENALAAHGLHAELHVAGKDHEKLIVAYPAIRTGTGYAAPAVQLEFGARATGEPHQIHPVTCDMAAERTFWEKATAAHVYCLQGRLRGERYSRHWYDLAALSKTRHYPLAARDRQLARQVAENKSIFFAEKDASGARIDYFRAIGGALRLIPEGASLVALENDYAAMREDGLLALDPMTFAELMERCAGIQDAVNRLALPS